MIYNSGTAMRCYNLPYNKKPKAVLKLWQIFITRHIVRGVIQFIDLFIVSSDSIIGNRDRTVFMFGGNTYIDAAALFIMGDAVLDKIADRTFEQGRVGVHRA